MTIIVPRSEVPPDLLEFFEPVDVGAPPDALVWKSENSSLQHYASYPTFLPEFAIRAGSSERGVCPTCGANYARVIERTFTPQSDVSAAKLAKGSRKGMAAEDGRADTPRGTTDTQTLSWRPTCTCAVNGPPVPAVALDPFFGSGTTGVAADRLGRSAVGIELNSEYTGMAVDRIRGDSPLFAEVTQAAG